MVEETLNKTSEQVLLRSTSHSVLFFLLPPTTLSELVSLAQTLTGRMAQPEREWGTCGKVDCCLSEDSLISMSFLTAMQCITRGVDLPLVQMLRIYLTLLSSPRCASA